MVGIGRREAYARIAHLLCELFVRLRAVGLTDGDTCEIPITQVKLGDALGLSAVHVNRTLQEIQGDALISMHGGAMKVEDWERLRAAGEFDAMYLHLRP